MERNYYMKLKTETHLHNPNVHAMVNGESFVKAKENTDSETNKKGCNTELTRNYSN